MFFVYILQSVLNGRFYIGYSESPERRLAEHNAGKVKSTKPYRPWKKVYLESYGSEIEAMRREKALKAFYFLAIHKYFGKTRHAKSVTNSNICTGLP
jgi:putative endonuclease